VKTDLWRGAQTNFVIHTKYHYNHPMKWLTGVYNCGSNNTTLLSRYDYAEHDLVGNRTMIRFEQKQPDGTVFLVKRRYEYDALYQLTREITDGTVNYDHQWQYDCIGNRLKFTKAETDETITYKYNAANQLIREVSNINGVTRYRYDANGNMIQKRRGWRVTRYVYDIEDRLRLAFGPEGLGFYLQDALGRRILRFGIPFKHKEAPHFSAGMRNKRGQRGRSGRSHCQRRSADEAAGRNTNPAAGLNPELRRWFADMAMNLESGCRYGFRHLVRLIDGIKCRLPRKLRRRIVLERYFHDGADVIADYDLFGRFCKASYLTPFLDENLLVDRRFAWRTRRYWYTQDGLGSVRQLIECSDRVRNSYAYTSWGEPLNWQERIFNRYTFTSREYNLETQLYHYRSREYDAQEGRFQRRDRLLSTNRYLYCENSPLLWVDPTGEVINVPLRLPIKVSSGGPSVGLLTPAAIFVLAQPRATARLQSVSGGAIDVQRFLGAKVEVKPHTLPAGIHGMLVALRPTNWVCAIITTCKKGQEARVSTSGEAMFNILPIKTTAPAGNIPSANVLPLRIIIGWRLVVLMWGTQMVRWRKGIVRILPSGDVGIQPHLRVALRLINAGGGADRYIWFPFGIKEEEPRRRGRKISSLPLGGTVGTFCPEEAVYKLSEFLLKRAAAHIGVRVAGVGFLRSPYGVFSGCMLVGVPIPRSGLQIGASWWLGCFWEHMVEKDHLEATVGFCMMGEMVLW